MQRASLKDSPRKLAYPGLPPETRLMVYENILMDHVMHIHRRGVYLQNKLYVRLIQDKLNGRLVFGEYEDRMIAAPFSVTSAGSSAQDISLKPMLPKLKEICFELDRCQTSQSASRGPQFTGAVCRVLADWKKGIATCNPGLTVVLRPDCFDRAARAADDDPLGANGRVYE